jgi:cytochrome c oxidase cbb3-type subunit 4
MDINDFRGIVTVVMMLAFVGLTLFAWHRHRKPDYDASAQLPLEEDRYITQDIMDKTRENT